MNFTVDVFVIWVKIRTTLKVAAPHRHGFCCFCCFSVTSRMPNMKWLRIFLPLVFRLGQGRHVFGKDERKASLGEELGIGSGAICVFTCFIRGF